MILVQKNGGGPFGSGFGQRHERGGRDRIVGPRPRPVAPRHAPASCGDERFLDPRHGGPSAVAMEFHGSVAAAAHDDFLAEVAAETSDDDLIGGIGGQGPAAASAEVRLHRFDGARSFDAKRCHRAATGRSKSNDAKRRRRIQHFHAKRRSRNGSTLFAEAHSILADPGDQRGRCHSTG